MKHRGARANPLQHVTAVLCGVGISLASAPLFAGSDPPPADPPAAKDYSDRPQTCEGCHELAVDDFLELDDGTKVSVLVDPAVHAQSIHGTDSAELDCRDCHRSSGRYPHRPVSYADERDLRSKMSKACYRCHFKEATRYRDSVHFERLHDARAEAELGVLLKQLEADDTSFGDKVEQMLPQTEHKHAPVCVDCHGSHDIRKASEPRERISQTCKSCHEEVEATYAKSVHGSGLTDGNEDVPVCTDCHSSHQITETDTRAFHAGSYEICADCHGDKEKMAKYDLSSDVLSTYLDDFHGSSNFLGKTTGRLPSRPTATCADCHGYHDVESWDEAQGELAARERTAKMCSKCHEGAEESFSDAWLSHSAPSLRHHPVAWAVKWGYRIAIPFMIVGLIIHILMHLIRAGLEPSEEEGEPS